MCVRSGLYSLAAQVQEPYVAMEIFCPKEYSGTLMELAQGRRGEYVDMKFLTENRVSIKYDLPLAEVSTRGPHRAGRATGCAPQPPLTARHDVWRR